MSDKTPTGSQRKSHVKVMFADGAVIWAANGPASDHILNRVVLKFVLACVLIYSLLIGRPDVAALDAWQTVTLWMSSGLFAVLWLYLAASIALFLTRAGIIRFVFTPFISVPLVFVTEMVTQVVIAVSTGNVIPPVGSFAQYLVRDIIVVLLFDIIYGSYVAPRHSLYRLVDPDEDKSPWPPRDNAAVGLAQDAPIDPKAGATTRGEATTTNPAAMARRVAADDKTRSITEAKGPVAAAPEPQPETTLAIGGEVLRIADLVSVHAEDHYIRVQTLDRRLLLRGRFSDVVERLGPDRGIQVTRSDWISRPHVVAIQRTEDYKLYVLTSDQQTLAVARARKADVMGFARQHDIPITRRR